jgi:hypothetical protein
MKVAIFDIDNCIAADSWRASLIDFGTADIDARYHAYHLKLGEDEFKNQTEFYHWANRSDLVAFITSRPERYRKETQAWLNKNIDGLVHAAQFVMLMRADTDKRRSVEVKADLLRVLRHKFPEFNFPDDVVAAFDDREDVVAMYQKCGIKTAQVLAIDKVELQEQPASVGSEILRPRPADLLRDSAALFEKRNADYGDSYRRAGHLTAALFPEGGVPSLTTPKEMLRYNTILMCASKLQRYAHNLKAGGHLDSARDLQVYAAMLEEATGA